MGAQFTPPDAAPTPPSRRPRPGPSAMINPSATRHPVHTRIPSAPALFSHLSLLSTHFSPSRIEPALSLPKGPSQTTRLDAAPTPPSRRPRPGPSAMINPSATRHPVHTRIPSACALFSHLSLLSTHFSPSRSEPALSLSNGGRVEPPAPESPGQPRPAIQTAHGSPFQDCGRALPSEFRVQPQPRHPTVGGLSAAASVAVGSA